MYRETNRSISAASTSSAAGGSGNYSDISNTSSISIFPHDSRSRSSILTNTEAPDTDSDSSDLETLIDEVESHFLTGYKRYNPDKPVVSYAEAKACPCSMEKTPTNWDEVDELLKDFQFEDVNPYSKSNNKSWTRPTAQEIDEKNRDKEMKCCPVYLAGSYEVMGHSVIGFEKPCSKLKCLNCDFNIQTFDNFIWDPTTDYLFLRNNMPDFDKVARKLQPKKGARAYACQCQCVSIDKKITHLLAIPHVRWICGKHTKPPTEL